MSTKSIHAEINLLRKLADETYDLGKKEPFLSEESQRLKRIATDIHTVASALGGSESHQQWVARQVAYG